MRLAEEAERARQQAWTEEDHETVHDQALLAGCKIRNGTTLDMRLPRKHFQIFVHCQNSGTSKIITLNVSQRDTACLVKRMIRSREGIPVGHQRLIYWGKQLEDGLMLADCNIEKGSTLHLLLRQLGGWWL